jgi:hypothetical protein
MLPLLHPLLRAEEGLLILEAPSGLELELEEWDVLKTLGRGKGEQRPVAHILKPK